MKKSSLGNKCESENAGSSSRVFDRDLLKGGGDFHDVLMDSNSNESDSVQSRRKKMAATDSVFDFNEKPKGVKSRRENMRAPDAVEKPSESIFKRSADFQQTTPQSGEEKIARPRLKRVGRVDEGERNRDARNSGEAGNQQHVGFWVGLKRILAFAFYVLMIVLVLVAIYKWAKPVQQFFEKPLKQVAVEGEFHLLTNQRAMDLINAQIDGHFLQLDLEKLKRGLEADPWIEHVYLSRRWPDTLVVKITEQKPIARWGAADNKAIGFVNQSGELILVNSVDPLMNLPWLNGDKADVREIMQQYQDLSTLLRTRNLDIVGLECDSKKSWRLIIKSKTDLKNNWEIAVGRDQVVEKMNRFLLVYDKFLSSVWKDVGAVDLRYTNGVAVRWLPDSEMAKRYLKSETTVSAGK